MGAVCYLAGGVDEGPRPRLQRCGGEKESGDAWASARRGGGGRKPVHPDAIWDSMGGRACCICVMFPTSVPPER